MKTRLLPFQKSSFWLVPMLCALVVSSTAKAQDVAVNPATSKKTANSKASADNLHAIPLQELMIKLQKNYGIYFSYQADALKETMVIYEGVDKKKTDASTVLNKVLVPAGLTYETINNVFIIKQAPVVEAIKSEKEVAPFQFPVTGVITDNNGPVANATVTEKGTNNITTTNAQGRFTLDLASPNAVLVITHVSYTTREVSVNGQSTLALTVVSNSKEMESVVVTALGIS